MHLIEAFFVARDEIVAEVGGPVPGLDLVEVLANAMVGNFKDHSVEEIRQLVFTCARQRNEEGYAVDLTENRSVLGTGLVVGDIDDE